MLRRMPAIATPEELQMHHAVLHRGVAIQHMLARKLHSAGSWNHSTQPVPLHMSLANLELQPSAWLVRLQQY